MKNAWVILSIISWSFLVLHPFAAHGAAFTLSDSALMSLDYDCFSRGSYLSNITDSATITNITDMGKQGVQFDILYPDTRNNIPGETPSLFWTSCIYGGKGTLTNRDISMFDTFALKITLVSASGISSPDEVGPLVVGALINQANYVYAYQPQVIATNDPYNPPSATSVTTTDASQIKLIGFTCNIPYWWYAPQGPLGPSPWDPHGAIISLLVGPAPNAVVITPEPATLLLLGLGGLAIVRKRR